MVCVSSNCNFGLPVRVAQSLGVFKRIAPMIEFYMLNLILEGIFELRRGLLEISLLFLLMTTKPFSGGDAAQIRFLCPNSSDKGITL